MKAQSTTTMIHTIYALLNRRNEKIILPIFYLKAFLSKFSHLFSSQLRLKQNSPLMILLPSKKPNLERLKPFRILTLIRSVDIGHSIKINDITGFLNYIMNIFSINISDDLTESSSLWLHSLKLDRRSNVEAITKRCRKSTNSSQRFS